jgi:hypothetical protein
MFSNRTLLEPCLFFIFFSISVFSMDTCFSNHCNDVTCGFKLTGTYNTTCDEEDVGIQYTTCFNEKKKIFHYWKPPATCTEGSFFFTLILGTTLLPKSVQVDCNFECGQGKYFNITTETCQECIGGTYSSLNLDFVNWNEQWPKQMNTFCSNLRNKTCSPWL